MLLRVAKWPLLAAVSLAVYLGCCQVQARCQPEARGGSLSLKGEQRGFKAEPGPGPGPAGAGGKSHCQWQRPPGLPPLAPEAYAETASPPTRGQSPRPCLGLGPGRQAGMPVGRIPVAPWPHPDHDGTGNWRCPWQGQKQLMYASIDPCNVHPPTISGET